MWVFSLLAAGVSLLAVVPTILEHNIPVACINLVLFGVNLYLSLMLLKERVS